MRIYIICPVRKQTAEQKVDVEKYVAELEAGGHDVFWPYRDAPQDSETGHEIVASEFLAIKVADEVHVFWDVNSKGSHFDLGMCYALQKKIVFKHLFQEDSSGKSYVKALKKYAERQTQTAEKNTSEEEKPAVCLNCGHPYPGHQEACPFRGR